MITLGVEDLDRAIAFYRDGLGLPLREGPEGIAFFETGSTWLSLYPREALAKDAAVESEGSGFRGFALAHNVRTRELVDELMSEVKVAGATVIKGPQDASWGGYSGYFKDPDEFLWEVAWNPHFWVE
jgi:catechol 2,3-dioxygenase-like lactoylglutathione lyase family enzyme